MLEYLLQEPLWLRIWVFWIVAVNFGAVFFLRRVEARWVLVAMIGAGLLMETLLAVNGYNRLLGLAHIIVWTPLVVYLWRRRGELPSGERFTWWLNAAFFTICTSLVIDVVDVVRYLLGDRA